LRCLQYFTAEQAIANGFVADAVPYLGGTTPSSSEAMDFVSVYRSRDSCQDIDVSSIYPSELNAQLRPLSGGQCHCKVRGASNPVRT
jgi:hypothetical protein